MGSGFIKQNTPKKLNKQNKQVSSFWWPRLMASPASHEKPLFRGGVKEKRLPGSGTAFVLEYCVCLVGLAFEGASHAVHGAAESDEVGGEILF